MVAHGYGSIPPMQYAVTIPSGTVLWSVLLPTGREKVLTGTGSRLEGSVRQVLPVRYSSRGFVAGAMR